MARVRMRVRVRVRVRVQVRVRGGRVSVDDCFPCDDDGTPLFAQPHQGELC